MKETIPYPWDFPQTVPVDITALFSKSQLRETTRAV